MNLLEAKVVKITSKPYNKFDKWWVGVISTCYGNKTESTLMFSTKEEALNLKVGYTFLT